MTSRERFSGGTRALVVFGGNCSSVEQRKRRWREAARRCLDFSETQRRRVELPSIFRKTRSSFARHFPGARMLAPCGVQHIGARGELEFAACLSVRI